MKIKLAIVDDQQLVRKGFAALLNQFDKFNVVLDVKNGTDLFKALAETEIMPEIILINFVLPDTTGLEILKLLKEKYPDLKVVFISEHDFPSFIIAAILQGANGFITLNVSPEEIESILVKVSDNIFYFSDEVLRAMRSSGVTDFKPLLLNNLHKLTIRELQVLFCLCMQLNSSEIGDALYLSRRTIESARESLLIKTESKNTAGLVLYAIKHQIIGLASVTR